MDRYEQLAARLRGLPVFEGVLPGFDRDAAPADPSILFAEWIEHAIDCGIREPHATVLSTLDASGSPNARVLILKGITPDGAYRFAGSRQSAKGDELGARPAAALTFYWPALGRQVRVRGPVREAGAEASEADFLARSAAARTEAVQSEWMLWEVIAAEIEFFQGDAGRRHQRLIYRRSEGRWDRQVVEVPGGRQFGTDAQVLHVPDDFDEPLPKELLDAFEA